MTEDRRSDEARAERLMRMGQPPRNRRELLRKSLWIGVWLIFLSSPVQDLASGRHTTGGTVAGWLGLAAFVGVYLSLVFRNIGRPYTQRFLAGILVALAVLAALLNLTLGASHWLGLFVYVSVA
ncbi:histidine kinase, partial [Streptomyces sp. Ru72]